MYTSRLENIGVFFLSRWDNNTLILSLGTNVTNPLGFSPECLRYFLWHGSTTWIKEINKKIQTLLIIPGLYNGLTVGFR